nr:cytochrome P450 CYP72A219-like [Tanacetum cinerariifolium]
MGTRPVVHFLEPTMIREALASYNQFQKPKRANPLAKLLVTGLLEGDGDQWAKHKKNHQSPIPCREAQGFLLLSILYPLQDVYLHLRKLHMGVLILFMQHTVPAFYVSCNEMDKWAELITKEVALTKEERYPRNKQGSLR